MAKKLLPIFTLLFILITSPVVASNNSSDRENHGTFVSAEAHEHEGGEEVSKVAKSDIGKKHQEDEDEDNDEDFDDEDEDDEDFDDDDIILISPNPSPSASPSASPVVTPSPDVSPSPDATPSPSPSVSPTPAPNTQNTNAIQNILDKIEELLTQLKNLF